MDQRGILQESDENKTFNFFKSQEFEKRGTHLKKAAIKEWESLNILETH